MLGMVRGPREFAHLGTAGKHELHLTLYLKNIVRYLLMYVSTRVSHWDTMTLTYAKFIYWMGGWINIKDSCGRPQASQTQRS